MQRTTQWIASYLERTNNSPGQNDQSSNKPSAKTYNGDIRDGGIESASRFNPGGPESLSIFDPPDQNLPSCDTGCM